MHTTHYLPNWRFWWNRFKLIAGCNDGPVELYDLANDPDEQINLAERERETVEDLKLKLRQELAQPIEFDKVVVPEFLTAPAVD
jgi:hypothetical protein